MVFNHFFKGPRNHLPKRTNSMSEESTKNWQNRTEMTANLEQREAREEVLEKVLILRTMLS